MGIVQYIIVRKDLVDIMGIGKTASQVAHASMGVILENKMGIVELNKNPDTIKWLHGLFTKLVVYVKSKQKLLNIANRLDEDGIKYKLIYDACLTKLEPEENGTTLTCLGIVPISIVPKYLKKLRLLE